MFSNYERNVRNLCLFMQLRNKTVTKDTNALSLLSHTRTSVSHFGKNNRREQRQRRTQRRTERRINTAEKTVRGEKDA